MGKKVEVQNTPDVIPDRNSFRSLGFLLLSLIVLLLGGRFALAQEEMPERSTLEQRYSRARIIKYDGSRFEARNVIISNDVIRFVEEGRERHNVKDVQLKDIEAVIAPTGNHLEQGLWGGFAISAITVGYAWLDIELDETRKLKENGESIFLGIVAGGTLIGGLIGAMIPEWETVFWNPGRSHIRHPNKGSKGSLFVEIISNGLCLNF